LKLSKKEYKIGFSRLSLKLLEQDRGRDVRYSRILLKGKKQGGRERHLNSGTERASLL
jgi:hypothetical protein